MKNKFIAALLISIISSCNVQNRHLRGGWESVLSIDEDGQVLSGTKLLIIKAVHQGCPIRVGWIRKLRNNERLEHVTDSAFLSVYKNEVFAQVKPIMRQSPSRMKAEIKLDVAHNQQWTGIISTNGILHSTITASNKDTVRKIASSWYINSNNCQINL